MKSEYCGDCTLPKECQELKVQLAKHKVALDQVVSQVGKTITSKLRASIDSLLTEPIRKEESVKLCEWHIGADGLWHTGCGNIYMIAGTNDYCECGLLITVREKSNE